MKLARKRCIAGTPCRTWKRRPRRRNSGPLIFSWKPCKWRLLTINTYRIRHETLSFPSSLLNEWVKNREIFGSKQSYASRNQRHAIDRVRRPFSGKTLRWPTPSAPSRRACSWSACTSTPWATWSVRRRPSCRLRPSSASPAPATWQPPPARLPSCRRRRPSFVTATLPLLPSIRPDRWPSRPVLDNFAVSFHFYFLRKKALLRKKTSAQIQTSRRIRKYMRINWVISFISLLRS